LGHSVNVASVLDAPTYWTPPDDDTDCRWLTHGVLPAVRQFLSDHRNHTVDYIPDEILWEHQEASQQDWIEIDSTVPVENCLSPQ
jgi:hypothetical protein